MKEYIRTSGFFVNLGASYKMDIMRAPPPFPSLQTSLLTHSGALKKPLQPDLKVKRSFDFLPLTVDFTCC